MSKIEELNNLFEQWKKEQKKESYNADTIPVKRIDKSSFCFDGFVFGEKSNTVLYILDESNLQEKSKESNDFFWLKGAYKIKNNINKNPIPRRIELMQEIIKNKFNDISLQDISYMNINKRGGFEACNDKILLNYYNKYKGFIFEEIKILDPKIIVSCTGNDKIYSDLVNNKEQLNCNYILNMPHPSCRYTDEKYKKEFEKEINVKLNGG